MTRNTSTQITTHLCLAERNMFEGYARSFALDPAGLLALLLVRELRSPRLALLVKHDVPANEPRRSKVTAHALDENLHRKVLTMAANHGQSVSHACAVIIRAELTERWLERALMTRFES